MGVMAQMDADRRMLTQLLGSGPARRDIAVAALVGNCEAIAASGLLPEPAEQSLRLLIAETLSAFNMEPHQKQKRPVKCSECGQNYADPPSRLCPGCQAYKEHQS